MCKSCQHDREIQETEEYSASEVGCDALLAQIYCSTSVLKTKLTPRRLFLHNGKEVEQKKTPSHFLSKKLFSSKSID